MHEAPSPPCGKFEEYLQLPFTPHKIVPPRRRKIQQMVVFFPRNMSNYHCSLLNSYNRGIIRIAHLFITTEYFAVISSVSDALIYAKSSHRCLHSKRMVHLCITRDDQRYHTWEGF